MPNLLAENMLCQVGTLASCLLYGWHRHEPGDHSGVSELDTTGGEPYRSRLAVGCILLGISHPMPYLLIASESVRNSIG